MELEYHEMQIIENLLLLSGLFRDSQEKAGLLESAGPETAPPGPSESYAGHACVSTERVRVCDSAFDLSLPHRIDVHLSLSLHVLSLICSLTLKSPCWRLNVKLSLSRFICFSHFCFCLLSIQLDLWVQLPPHSRICEWRCGTAGPETVSDAPSRAPSRANGTSESQRDRRSVSTPHTHQPCTGCPGQTGQFPRPQGLKSAVEHRFHRVPVPFIFLTLFYGVTVEVTGVRWWYRSRKRLCLPSWMHTKETVVTCQCELHLHDKNLCLLQ